MIRILRFLLYFCINAILIFISLLFYFRYADPIISRTADSFFPELIIPLLVIITAVILFAGKSKFRKYGLGLSSMVYSVLIATIFYANQALPLRTGFKAFELGRIETLNGTTYAHTTFKGLLLKTPISLGKAIPVDSIDIEEKQGLFGMRVLTNETRIREKIGCKSIINPEDNLSPREFADLCTYRRCFQLAVDYYTQLIERDSANYEAMYDRGLIYLQREQYSAAMADFVNAISTKNLVLSKVHPEISFMEENIHSLGTVVAKILSKDTAGLAKSIRHYNQSGYYYSLIRRIELCQEKLMHNNREL